MKILLNKNKKRGFTLIELLVVVAILSLLSSIILASLGEARERAAWSRFDQELLQVRNAIQLYRSDNGNWPQYNVSSNYPNRFVDIVSVLNNGGYYTGSVPKSPDGFQPAYYNSLPGTYDCGSQPSNGNGAIAFVYVSRFFGGITNDDVTEFENSSSLFKDLYHSSLGNLDSASNNYACFAIIGN